MNLSWKGAVYTLLICLFIGLIVWTYFGGHSANAGQLETHAPDQSLGSYPTQYVPVIVEVPGPTPTRPPLATLHLGLQLRWDGEGELYLDGYYWNPGTHLTRTADKQIDADTIRIYGSQWYSPNPFDWQPDNWYCHYNTVTNHAELCSSQSDPAWKWIDYWILPADLALANGQTVMIDGQVFNVSGPHTFLTGYGEEARFWRLSNRDRFLYYYRGDEWMQYVERGDAVLFYDFDGSRIRLFSNVKRTYYYNDKPTSNSVRYEESLTNLDGIKSTASELRLTHSQLETESTPTTFLNSDLTELIKRVDLDSQSFRSRR